MNSLFRYDGYLNRILTKLMYIAALNLLFLICSIPVITIGASCTAMYTVLFRFVRNDEPDILKTFFKAFRENLKKASCIWAAMLAAAGTLAVNYYALYHMDGGWTEALRVFFNLIFQKFFRTIPAALEESARLDGCSDLRLFFKIILPITKPVIFTMALITAIGQWNDFYMPMVLLGNKNVTTLTLAIYRYVGQFTKYMSESMAAVVITLIPIIIIYFVFSSQIVEGLTGGAVKG